MQNLREAVIVHSRKSSVVAAYFREFVKWIGVSYFDFIYDGNVEELNNLIKNEGNQIDILLSLDGILELDSKNGMIQIQIEGKEIWEEDTIRLKKEPLIEMWQQIYSALKLKEESQQIMNTLIEVYCEHNLLHKLYSDKFNMCEVDCGTELKEEHKEKLKVQYGSWLEVAKKLQQYQRSLPDRKEIAGEEYLEYAMVFCCRKMNEICMIIEGRGVYDTLELINLADKIYEKDAGFYMVENLKAKVTRYDNLYKLRTIVSNEECTKRCKVKVCNSFNYYRIGKYYEINGYEERAMQEYKKSYELNPLNFRALFKLVVDKIKKKDVENARLYLKELLWLLQIGGEIKAEKDFSGVISVLKPLELEYAVKCYFLLGQLESDDYENQITAADYFQKAIDIQESIKKNVFIEGMYPQEKEKDFIYRCLDKRLKICTIEHKLRGCINTDMYQNWRTYYEKRG